MGVKVSQLTLGHGEGPSSPTIVKTMYINDKCAKIYCLFICNIAVVVVLMLLHNMLWRVVLSSWSPSQHVLSGAKCNYLFTLFIRHLATRGGFTGTPVSGGMVPIIVNNCS